MSTKRRAYLTEMKTQLTLAVPALFGADRHDFNGVCGYGHDRPRWGRWIWRLWRWPVALGSARPVRAGAAARGYAVRGAASRGWVHAGGEHMQGVGHVMRQGIWMALFISVPLILIVYLVSFHLADMGVEGLSGS